MSILTLTSTNPLFSHIIQKNPATIRDSEKPFQRDLRRGRLYGWYLDGDQAFRLWFKDHPTETSFAGGARGDFEYLDKTRYSSPYLPLCIIQESLATAQKGQEHDVTGYVATVSTTIHTPAYRQLEIMIKHYSSVATVTLEPVAFGYQKVTVTSDTVKKVLNILQVLCLMQSLRDDDVDLRMNTGAITKYSNLLNRSEAPYYVRYLFASRCISEKGLFSKVRAELQGPGMTMFWGDTQRQRFECIKKQLTGGYFLVDIGCGDLYYSKRLSGKYTDVLAIEADEELNATNVRKAKHDLKNVSCQNLQVTGDWVREDNGVTLSNAHVLMTEVMEHMPKEDAGDLLKALLEVSSAARIVVTVPNHSFNVNYGLQDCSRHPDHHYEPTFEEWCDYTVTLAAEHGWAVENSPIGDVVDDQSVSTMTVFTNKVD